MTSRIISFYFFQVVNDEFVNTSEFVSAWNAGLLAIKSPGNAFLSVPRPCVEFLENVTSVLFT